MDRSVVIQYAHEVCVYDKVRTDMVDRLYAQAEKEGLIAGSDLMDEFYDTYGCGTEIAHAFIDKTTGWINIIKNKCAVFQVQSES
ncbi:hypothetical protein FOA52_014466 [Chlamydomonas sp. UWO 241]|nr:hypothetical protein FOA52_014466 [Chlamydomonas sp. UWO 241]